MSHPPLRCYAGKVMHQRHGDLDHRLTYQVFTLCLTLSQSKEASKRLPFFSHNGFNLFSLHDKDHMEKGYDSLPVFVHDMLVQGEALTPYDPAPARIDMLAYPRFLGKAFNPLTIFICYDEDDQPIAILYQVRNTFKERHHYAVRLSEPGSERENHWQHGCEKRFHVSPFMSMEGRYDFDITLPDERFAITIRQSHQNTPRLTAIFTGKQIPLTGWKLLSLAAQYCQGGWKILGAIHWEALKLWWKGAPFHKKPKRPDRPVTPAFENTAFSTHIKGDGK